MNLRLDRARDLEHLARGMHLQMHARRLGERHSLERLELDLLIHHQTLPSTGEQAADINLIRSHNIEEGRPAMGAF